MIFFINLIFIFHGLPSLLDYLYEMLEMSVLGRAQWAAGFCCLFLEPEVTVWTRWWSSASSADVCVDSSSSHLRAWNRWQLDLFCFVKMRRQMVWGIKEALLLQLPAVHSTCWSVLSIIQSDSMNFTQPAGVPFSRTCCSLKRTAAMSLVRCFH